MTAEIDDISFCSKCFSADELIELAMKKGIKIRECPICGTTNTFSIPASNQELKRVFRALIRVNYSEWDYNEHLGGDHLSSLLFGKNAILDLKDNASQENFWAAIEEIESGWYPKDESDISLGGEYYNGNILDGIKSRLDYRLTSILRRGFTENYFSIQKELTKLIANISKDISIKLPKGRKFYRARIGVTQRYKSTDLWDDKNYYLPFTDDQISAPPLHIAPEGRLNRARVSVLYLASDQETAVAEVRPHPGHLITTARFRLKQSVCIADLTNKDIRRFLSDSRLEVLRLIMSFNTISNLPITPDTREYYIMTQLISDCLREAGFDGIRFQSSVGSGSNLVCFSPSLFSLEKGSEKALEVTSVHYQMKDIVSLQRPLNKEDYTKDDQDPFSALIDVIERGKSH